MSDVNWWLMLLSFLLGALITWFWSVRRATREVPRTVVDRDRDVTGSVGGKVAGVGAGVAGAAAGAAALGNRDKDIDLDNDVDMTTRRGDLDVDRPATEVYDRTTDEPISTSWDAPDVNAPSVDAPDVDGPSFERPDLDAPDVNAPDLDAPDADAPTIQRSSLDLPEADAPDLGAPDVESPGVAGGAAGAAAAGAAGLGAASWASRSGDDSDVAADPSSEPVHFTDGASDLDTSGDFKTSTDAEVIESESGLETPAAPTGEADWSDTSGPSTSVLGVRDAGDISAASEPVVEPVSSTTESFGTESSTTEAVGTESASTDTETSFGSDSSSDTSSDTSSDPETDSGGLSGAGAAGVAGAGVAGAGAAVGAKKRSGGGAAKLTQTPEGKFGKGSADPGADGSGPEGWSIKGNEDSNLFHTQESPYYGRTKAEIWFDSEESARGAGFVRWDEKDRSGSGSGGAAKLVEIPEGRFGKGSTDPAADGSGPEGWAIKGNENSMLFHTEDSPAYGRTKAEVWFQDEEAARKAGFTKWNERNR